MESSKGNRKAPVRSLAASLRSLLAEVAERLGPEGEGALLDTLLKLFADRSRIIRGEAEDPAALLESWRGRQDSWCYASILLTLVNRGLAGDSVRAEASEVLVRTQPPAANTVYLFLALALASDQLRVGPAPGPDDPAVDFLHRAIRHWEPSTTAAANAHAYRVLVQACPDPGGEYRRKVTHWTKIELQHAEASELRPMLQRGHFFGIFRYYFKFLHGWGLGVLDNDGKSLPRRLEPAPEEAEEELERWRRAGRPVPTPLHPGPAVSADFVVWGTLLMLQPQLSDPKDEAARREFERRAASVLPQLLDSSAELPALPAPIQDLIAAYGQRFRHYTRPDGTPPL